MIDIFKELLQQDEELRKPQEGEYRDKEGILICGECGTRREMDILLPDYGGERIFRVGIPCKCRTQRLAERNAKMEEQQKKHKLEQLRAEGIDDARFRGCSFAQDDGRNGKTTAVCKSYADKWAEMKKENIGMIMHGGVGTGKSFLAGCIANELIDRFVPVCVTTLPRLINRLGEDYEMRQVYIDELSRFDLLVIDDFGVERQTEYVSETVFNIIDTRLREGLPLIVTTNLTQTELKNPRTMTQRRIYDRIIEMCPIAITIEGATGRARKADKLRERARQIIRGEAG